MDIAACKEYGNRLSAVLQGMDWRNLVTLYGDISACIERGQRLFVCGNGGSLGNAMHIANDLTYPITKQKGKGLRIYALGSNPSTLSCLANDEGYEHIFSYELAVHADPDDILVVLSGSGNSANIIEVLNTASQIGVKSYGILGFDGGRALSMVDVPIHINIDDMQIAEDMQMICFNIIVQNYFRQLMI